MPPDAPGRTSGESRCGLPPLTRRCGSVDDATARKQLEKMLADLDRSIGVLQGDPVAIRDHSAADAGSDLTDADRAQAMLDRGHRAAQGRDRGAQAAWTKARTAAASTVASRCRRAAWRPVPRPPGAWSARAGGTPPLADGGSRSRRRRYRQRRRARSCGRWRRGGCRPCRRRPGGRRARCCTSQVSALAVGGQHVVDRRGRQHRAGAYPLDLQPGAR